MRACRRYISSSAPLRAISSPFHSFRASRLLQLLSEYRETRNSVYPLVEAIHDANLGVKTLQHHLNLTEGPRAEKRKVKQNQMVLKSNQLSAAELEKWKYVLDTPNISVAARLLRRAGYITRDSSSREEEADEVDTSTHPARPSSRPVPSWVLLYLISHKVRAPPHATGPMLSLTLSHINYTPPELRGALIILSMFQLAKFNAVLPMQLLTSHFLQLDLAPKHHGSDISVRASKIYFNLLLIAIARNTVRSAHSAASSLALVKAMDSRKLRLWPETCDELLKDRFVVVELTKWLREQAVREGYVPGTGHLDAYARMFAGANPVIEDEERYQKAVAELQSDEGFFTDMVAKEDRLSAIRFLHGLTEPWQPIKYTIEEPEITEPSPSPSDDSITPTPLPAFLFTSHRNFKSLSHSLQAEWMAGFTKVVKDVTRYSAHEIINFFEWGVPTSPSSQDPNRKFRVRPTLGLYTTLIRGLLVRGEQSSNSLTSQTNGSFLLAEQYFTRLRTTGFPLDSHAVAVGLEALTRVGKPHKAFALLNDYCLLSPRAEPEVGIKAVHPKTEISAIALTDFMVSLMRIGRYDCVLWLFRHSVELYSVYLDNRAVSIFLQSTRKAQKTTTEGWGGFWSLLKKQLTRVGGEKGNDSEMAEKPRTTEMALQVLHAMVGTGDELVPYQAGRVWYGETPFSRAQRIFWSCVVGQAWTSGMASQEHDRNPGSNRVHNYRGVVESYSRNQFSGAQLYTDTRRGEESVDRLLAISSPAQPHISGSATSFFDSLAVPFPSSTTRARLSLADLFRNRKMKVQTLTSYSQVVLQDTHFRDYILLLGLAPQSRPLFQHSNDGEQTEVVADKETEFIPPINELPLVLAWQRYLGVPPSRDTLAAAIVLFGEYGGGVNDVPPLVDEFRRWTSGGRRVEDEDDRLTYGWGPGGEYVRLIQWIEDWVREVEEVGSVGTSGSGGGVGAGTQKKSLMPEADMLTKWRRIIFKMREGST